MTYLSVLAPPWLMGRKKGTNDIAISYSQDVANRFGRRVRHIVRSDDYARIMDTAIVADNQAVDNWALETDQTIGRPMPTPALRRFEPTGS